jgi:hypothetical protein
MLLEAYLQIPDRAVQQYGRRIYRVMLVTRQS